MSRTTIKELEKLHTDYIATLPAPSCDVLEGWIGKTCEIQAIYWSAWEQAFAYAKRQLVGATEAAKHEVVLPQPDLVINAPCPFEYFQGIDYYTMLHTRIMQAIPFSCDPCCYQYCLLPSKNAFATICVNN